jgi:gliding motility-associated lipoprotein GldH
MWYKNRKSFIRYSVLLTILFFFGACNFIGIHENLFYFPQHEWLKNDKPVLKIAVIDTTASYKTFLVVRHTAAFSYNNLFVNFTFIPSGGTAAHTQLLNLQLGNKADWFGNNIDDVIEHRIEVKNMPAKFRSGNNQFILQYEMPDDELSNIISVGVRLEKN